MKGSVIIGVIILLRYSTAALKSCPGTCVKNATACREKGGKILAYCTNGQACCDFSYKRIGTCGSKKSGFKEAIFQSPNYPDYDSGDSVCKFVFELKPDFQGIAVEFVDVYMEGNGFMPHSACESDMIFLQGFHYWQPPPRCGNLTGYIALIDKSKNTGKMKSLSIVAIMSSKRYKWKIRISHQHLHHSPDNESNSIPEESPKDKITADPILDSLFEAEQFTNGWNRPEPGIPIYGQNRQYNKGIMLETETSSGENADWDITEPFVVNGEDTVIAEVPWQASLRHFYPPSVLKRVNQSDILNRERDTDNCTADGKHFCGGSIISDRHILSASHCFYVYSKYNGWKRMDEVNVFLGDTDLCLDDEVKYGQPSQLYGIENIIFHYAYDDENMAINDVLVIKLKEKINFTDYIKPIALSKRNKTYEGRKAKVSGWGLTNLTIPQEINQLPLILQSTDEIYIQKRKICYSYLNQGFGISKQYVERFPKYMQSYNSVLCTTFNGSEPRLVGQGDSGGPLVLLDEEQQPIQIGVVSYGLPVLKAKDEHDNTFVDFFQDVSFYRNWIDLAMTV